MFLFHKPPRMRTLLILGRVSNLPTVWSNCLAGWWLSGGGPLFRLIWVCLGTSLLYLGGMFLNDAFDAQYDRQRRVSRPIPSGAIQEREVWYWGLGLLGLGLVSLMGLRLTTAFLALALTALIFLYNAVHKAIALAPVLMAACRVSLYLIAASVATRGVSGLAMWSALALGCYIIGVSYVARKEGTRVELKRWPLFFLGAPFFLAWLVNENVCFHRVGLVFFALLAWVLWALRLALRKGDRNITLCVSMLLAGIVMVDCLAVGEPFSPVGFLFAAWFILALILQQRIPAT
jgi:4-hydroxybenzoate polyprenyltransferase